MFHLAFAKIVQVRLPVPVLFQIFRHMLGEENVSGVTAIHHSLRHVDPGAGDIRALVHINYPADRTAMHTHTQLKLRVRL